MEDNKGAIDFWFYHALISEDTRDGIYATCNFSNIGPLQTNAQPESVNKSKVSATALRYSLRQSDALTSQDTRGVITISCRSYSPGNCRQMHTLRL